MKQILVALSLGAVLSQDASAQQRPDFSGTWIMDASRSDLAVQTPPVDVARLVIRQRPDEIQIDTTTQQGFTTEKYRLATTTAEVSPSRSTPTFRWNNTTLVTLQEMEINGFAVTATQQLRLDAGGGELTIGTEVVIQHGYSGSVNINGINTSGNVSRMTNVFVKSR